jgi:hypothetical protein
LAKVAEKERRLIAIFAADVGSLFRQQFRRGAFSLTRAALRRAPPVT